MSQEKFTLKPTARYSGFLTVFVKKTTLQGQGEWCFEQSGLREGVLAHGMGLEQEYL